MKTFYFVLLFMKGLAFFPKVRFSFFFVSPSFFFEYDWTDFDE